MQHEQQPNLMQRASAERLRANAAERMRSLLAGAGFTAEQLSAALELDEKTMRDWCDGNVDPPADVIQALERLAAIHKSLG